MAEVARHSPPLSETDRNVMLSSHNNDNSRPEVQINLSDGDLGSSRKRRLSSSSDVPMDDADDIIRCSTSGAAFKRYRLMNSSALQTEENNANRNLYQFTHVNQVEASESDSNDIPRYSARTLDTHRKQIFDEFSDILADKNADFCKTADSFMKDLDRTQQENRCLKRAVTIQNAYYNEMESQLAVAKEGIAAANAYAQRMQQINHALSMRVQHMESCSGERGGSSSTFGKS